MSNLLNFEDLDTALNLGEGTKELSFIVKKGPDRKSAAERYYLVEDLLRTWYDALNSESCNTREMPYELRVMYEKASDMLIDIREEERKIML